MKTLAVVYFLDEKGKPNLNVFQGSIFPEVDLLGLDGLEKALGGSVVVGIALAGHADPEAVLEEHLYIVVRGILDTSIRVMDDSLWGTAICNGHLEGLQTQSGVDVARDGISHGTAGKEVQDDRQIHEGIADSYIGDIRRPGLVWSRNGEVMQEIGMNPMAVAAVSGSNPAALWSVQQSALTHDTVYFLVVCQSACNNDPLSATKNAPPITRKGS